jgi:hypothetical protein
MKVGDYVRTKDGRIFKWNNLCTTDKKDYEEHTRKILFIEDEIKSSPNIIDLIEVGDYVNGYLVKSVSDNGVYIDIPFVDNENIGCDIDLFRSNEIKSIVTKEQFKSMEYKIGE